MGCILSWREFFKIHAVKEETANGFRIHGPRAGKTTADKGKKAAAANWVFQQWRWRWHLCIWSKWGLEGFSQFSSSLLWSWRALRCYTEGDIVTHLYFCTLCCSARSFLANRVSETSLTSRKKKKNKTKKPQTIMFCSWLKSKGEGGNQFCDSCTALL